MATVARYKQVTGRISSPSAFQLDRGIALSLLDHPMPQLAVPSHCVFTYNSQNCLDHRFA